MSLLVKAFKIQYTFEYKIYIFIEFSLYTHTHNNYKVYLNISHSEFLFIQVIC